MGEALDVRAFAVTRYHLPARMDQSFVAPTHFPVPSETNRRKVLEPSFMASTREAL